MSKRASICLLLLFFAALIALSYQWKPVESDQRHTVDFLASDYLASFTLREKHDRRNTTTYRLIDGDRVLKLSTIRNIEKEAAAILLDDGIMSLRALYADSLSPYPGDISRRIVHSQKFRPRFVQTTQNGTRYAYFVLFANARFGYGTFADDRVKYKSLVGWFYCEQVERFYKVRLFVPKETGDQELETFFLSLRCAAGTGKP